MPTWPEWIDRESRRLAEERASADEIVKLFVLRQLGGRQPAPKVMGALERESLELRIPSRRPSTAPVTAVAVRTLFGMIPTGAIAYILAGEQLRPSWNGDGFSLSTNAKLIISAFIFFAALNALLQVVAEWRSRSRDDEEDRRSIERQVKLFFVRAVQFSEGEQKSAVRTSVPPVPDLVSI